MKKLQKLLVHEDISFEKLPNYKAVINPANGENIAFVRCENEKMLLKKIELSKKAQKAWSKCDALTRSNLLLEWFNLIIKHKKTLAKIMTLEQGKSLKEALGEIEYAASFVKWFSEEARRINGDVLTSLQNNQKLLTIKQAIGVSAAITPWNFPSSMITRKVAPCLAAGCSMLVKPASSTPLSAYALENLAKKAKIPKDLFIVVFGDAKMISDIFCESEIIRKVSFTGSTEIGKEIYKKCANSVKKISLELGGNAPFIVFDDANIDKATDAIMASKFRNSGQTCICANRIYVQDKIYDEVIKKLEEKIKALKVGDGLEKGVDIGPLIDEKAVKKVSDHIEDAIKKGAKCIIGGERDDKGGTFFKPTLLSEVKSNMKVSKEETFGPLCPVFRFESEDEVIKQANDTEFGLASYIFTENISRKWRVSEALEYGMVGINTGSISNTVAPFGGVKQSGIGREGSKYGIDEYIEIKYLCVDIS